MDLIIAIIVGGIIGWLASILMKTNSQQGLLGNIVVGIVGSALGSWLAPKIGIAPQGGLMGWVVGIGGAALLILILKVLGVFK